MNRMKLGYAKILLALLTACAWIHGVSAEQLCVPGRFYCGSQIVSHVHQEEKIKNRLLYKCDGNGTSFTVSFVCYAGCRSVENVNSYCLCVPGEHYCGHELKDFRTETFQYHWLYKCDTWGTNLTVVYPLQHECKINWTHSYWFPQYCYDGARYCGYTLLKELGWYGYHNDTLYRCDSGGTTTSVVANCTAGGCVPNYAWYVNWPHCKCEVNRHYCAHELHQYGWMGLSSYGSELFRCTANGTTVEKVSEGVDCESCVSTSTSRKCECEEGAECKSECRPKTYASWCTCQVNKRYCGHELSKLGWIGYENNTIYQCDGGNNVNTTLRCESDCRRTWRSGLHDGDPECDGQCIGGELYCGYKMKGLGWEEYSHGTLYKCNPDGRNASVYAFCARSKCKGSYCKCDYDRAYCGHELRDKLGYEVLDSRLHNLYKCYSDGSPYVESNCQTCIGRLDSDPFMLYKPDYICNGQCRPSKCTCVQKQRYCGHVLRDVFNWHILQDNAIYECDGGDKIKEISSCTICAHRARNPICVGSLDRVRESARNHKPDCSIDRFYCGYSLYELGWNINDNDTLYKCVTGGQPLMHITNCSPGQCLYNRCTCIPDRYYCGSELYLLGWREQYKNGLFKWDQDINGLFKCAPNGTAASHVLYCDRCVIGTMSNSKCNCTETATCPLECQPSRCHCSTLKTQDLCGHELIERGWRLQNHSIYACSGEDDVSSLQVCQTSCTRIADGPVCTKECEAGKDYCGYKLHELGYEDYINRSLYLCKASQSPLVLTGEAVMRCTKKCRVGLAYCGYDIVDMWDVTPIQHQHRFRCSVNNSFEMTAACTTCITVRYGDFHHGAYCRCMSGWRYCKSNAIKYGWAKDDQLNHRPEYPELSDQVFRCNEKGLSRDPIDTCAKTECRNPQIGVAYCPCTPNRTYCGHELYERYNSLDTVLYSHDIYKCSMTRISVSLERRCVHCIRSSDVVTCRQECIVNQKYCGSDLQLLEGWSKHDVRSDWLYLCGNNTIEQPSAECPAGCVSRITDGVQDSYCATPWYWIFIGIVVPLVFMILAFVFVRYFLKHRRLKKSIEAHRIDAKQLLSSTAILGAGEFGEVWKATYTPKDGRSLNVAMKISNEKADAAAKLACANCFLQEAVVLNILSHPNIVKAFGICTNFKDRRGNRVPALVLEYMNGGSAIAYIRAERNRLTERDLSQIFTQISQAGAHLFKMGIIHRDIGARNVLVEKDTRTGRAKVAKLTDFGLAKDIGNKTSMYKAAHPERITFHCQYTAPEGFKGCFSSKSDVWSFAIFMWELYALMEEVPSDDFHQIAPESSTGPTPYPDIHDWQEVIRVIVTGRKPQKPKTLSDYIYRKMLDCWQSDPDLRPSFDALLKFFHTQHVTKELKIVPTSLPVAAARLSNVVSAEHNSDEYASDIQPDGYSRACP